MEAGQVDPGTVYQHGRSAQIFAEQNGFPQYLGVASLGELLSQHCSFDFHGASFWQAAVRVGRQLCAYDVTSMA